MVAELAGRGVLHFDHLDDVEVDLVAEFTHGRRGVEIRSRSRSRSRRLAAASSHCAPRGEELAQQVAAGVSQDPLLNLRAMVEQRLGEQVDHRPGSARLGIEGAEHHALEARVHERHGTHGAWLESHVDLALRQAVIAQQLRRMPQGHDLGVGRWVGGGDRAVVAGGDHLAHAVQLAHDHGAHRNLANQPGVLGLVERHAHAGFVAVLSFVGLGHWCTHATQPPADARRLIGRLRRNARRPVAVAAALGRALAAGCSAPAAAP